MKMKTTISVLFVLVVLFPLVNTKAIIEEGRGDRDEFSFRRANPVLDEEQDDDEIPFIQKPGISRTNRRSFEEEPVSRRTTPEGSRLKSGRLNGINFAGGPLRRARPQRNRNGAGRRRRPGTLRRPDRRQLERLRPILDDRYML